MDIFPDTVGLLLEESITILKDNNYELSVTETFSPKDKEKKGECRVIRQKIIDSRIQLIVSYF